ncbi:hypothetical protein EAG_16112 [Camponotus floridanus]|uniref:Uncharacterized protein n=1 Tax=Camponotus floridanus TaxID=104421 RepID=E2A1Y7_CAMFO|nr:hypothetical protein EAG_16112 [Camponotus floridanus]
MWLTNKRWATSQILLFALGMVLGLVLYGCLSNGDRHKEFDNDTLITKRLIAESARTILLQFFFNLWHWAFYSLPMLPDDSVVFKNRTGSMQKSVGQKLIIGTI